METKTEVCTVACRGDGLVLTSKKSHSHNMDHGAMQDSKRSRMTILRIPYNMMYSFINVLVFSLLWCIMYLAPLPVYRYTP